jgi:hypothetical protein
MASQTPLDSPVWFHICDSRIRQAAATIAPSKDQVIIVVGFVRICVCAGCSWFAVSSVGQSLSGVENPTHTTFGSGALLQGIC